MRMLYRRLLNILVLLVVISPAAISQTLTWTIEADASWDQSTATLSNSATVWNAFSGAHTDQSLGTGEDGWAEFTVSELNKIVSFGFSKVAESSDQYNFLYNFDLKTNNTATVKNNGGWLAGLGSFVVGDVFRISRENGYIKFYKNGTLQYTSTSQVNDELVLDVGMQRTGAEVSGISASFADSGDPGDPGDHGDPGDPGDPPAGAVTWTVEANASFDSGTKTVSSTATVWNEFSGAHTNQSLGSGEDGWAEFTVSTLNIIVTLGFSKVTETSNQYDFAYNFDLKNNNTATAKTYGGWLTGLGSFSVGDVFRISRENGYIKFYKNGTVVYTSTSQINDELVLDVGMQRVGAEVSSVEISFGDEGTGSEPDPGPPGPTPITDLAYVPQYNGNISAIMWKGSGDEQENIYNYGYDAANRLKSADYSKGQAQGSGWSETQSGGFSVYNVNYDLNGNIQTLNRQMIASDLETMDALTYSYEGNQLTSVSDAARYAGFHDRNTSGVDYTYDKNGNLKEDLNKEITQIEYNHLNLPNKVTKANGDYIEYIYDASGIKIQQIVHEGAEVKTTDYMGNYIYEDDEIALIQHDEGRVVPQGSEWEYQYHIKDHLGNVRTTFTTAPKTIDFFINFEQLGNDDIDLAQVDLQTIVANDIFDHTDATGTTYQNAQRLNGTDGEQVGTALAFPVGKGDTLNASVFAKYVEITSNPTNAAASLATALIGAFTGSPSTFTTDAGASTITGNYGSGSLIGGTGFPLEDANGPRAFLNLVFLPEDQEISLQNGVSFAYDQLDAAATQGIGQSKNQNFDELTIEDFVAPGNGYVMVYLSNESDFITEVYFDDLSVTINEHPVIQSDDYYPFGLSFNSYQRVTAKENKYNTFQDQEKITDLDLNWIQFKWRNHDPAIGRFFNVDPLAESYVYNSPYAFSENHVTSHIELEGLEKISIHSASFAPFNRFGGPFKGDGNDRKFSTNPQSSSRISGSVNLNLSGKGITQTGDPSAQGSVSVNMLTNSSSYSEAEMTSSLSNQYADGTTAMADVNFHLSGNNSQIPRSPDIDAKGNLQVGVVDLGEDGSMAIFSGGVTGDKFPANETYIMDASGTGVYLGVSGADGNPFTSLPGDNDREMSSFNIGVKFNADGNIENVQYNGTTYSVEDWNKQFQQQDPQSGKTSTNYD